MRDIFALLFIVSFLALLVTLAVMHIRKCMNKGKGDVVVKKVKPLGKTPTADVYETISQLKNYELSYDLSSGEDHSVETKYKANENGSVDFIDCRWDDESWMKREVNGTQEKWKETLPKHSVRIKLRNSRKLRNKRKGKK